MSEKINLTIILGSVRIGRFGEWPAKMIKEVAEKMEGFEVSFIDLKEENLPNFESAVSPAYITNKDYGNEKINWSVEKYMSAIEQLHVGELIVNDIDKDGTFSGYNFDLLRKIKAKIKIPMIASGGAKSYGDISSLFSIVDISAAAGALFVYYGRYNAVLISYPSKEEKLEMLNGK